MMTSPLLSPAPAPVPAWLASWTAGPVEIDATRARASTWPAEVRAALVRYPFDCVVRCVCKSSTCSSRCLIVVGALLTNAPGARVVLFLRAAPGAELLNLELEGSQLEVVAYRGGLDSATMQALLRPAGQA